MNRKKPEQDTKVTSKRSARRWLLLAWNNLDKLAAVTALVGTLLTMLYFVRPTIEHFFHELFGIKAWYHAVDFKITCQPGKNTADHCSVPPHPTASEIALHWPNRDSHAGVPNAAKPVRLRMRVANFYHYEWKCDAQFCEGDCIYAETLAALCATLDRIDGHQPSWWPWNRNNPRLYGCAEYGTEETPFYWVFEKGDIVYATETSETHPVPGRVSFDGKPGNASQVTSLAEANGCFRILDAAYWDSSPERTPEEQSDYPHNISLRMVKTPCL